MQNPQKFFEVCAAFSHSQKKSRNVIQIQTMTLDGEWQSVSLCCAGGQWNSFSILQKLLRLLAGEIAILLQDSVGVLLKKGYKS